MSDEITLSLRDAVDSQAIVEFRGVVLETAAELSATLYGPTCAYARTLPTQFELTPPGAGARCEMLVLDPCYWTPALPFLYELALRWRDSEGKQHEERRSIGLRRLSPRGSSLYWEGKRIVLRGAHADSLRPEMVSDARAAEVTLIVPNPSGAQCELADLHGIPIVADLRELGPVFDEALRLARHPAVVMILFDGGQADAFDAVRMPQGSMIAVAAYADDSRTASQAPLGSQVVAVELAADSRPPSWLRGSGKPAIAIRRGQTYADLQAARAACDRLQAELAPEFDLAGYFV